MYRNVVYHNKSRSIHMWGWDAHGNRIFQEIDYNPYLYLEDKKGTAKSIYGTSLKKREFPTLWDRNNFVKEGKVRRIFENLPPYQQWLVDNYYHNCESPEFSAHPLKVMFFDLECPGTGRFPEPELAENVINLLTCYDSFSKRYTVFGLKKFTNPDNRKDVDYFHCKSEEDLLKRFIGHFSTDYPDVLCGFNSSGFDVPYLINRITFQLGKEWADELSPMGRIYERVNPTGKFGQPSKEYIIEGISCLDYLVMYQKFSMDKQESYKLDYIGEVELGQNKVNYEGSLWDLSVNDWDTYTTYNIIDVELIVNLDAKLDYISLLRFLAYTGLCSLENAIKTVPAMNGAIAIQARRRGEFIPTFIKPVTDYKAPGGFVADPKVGFSENIVSFDANSLYPSVMISLNLSPETKLGRVEKVGDKIHVHHTSGRIFELTPEKFAVYLKEEKACLSKSGHLFSQKRKGIVPEFLDNLYTKRKEMKSKMIDAKIRLKNGEGDPDQLQSDIQRYDTFQYAYKIHLNSLYGYMLNKYAPMGDEDIGTSVTLTGQAVIKQSNELFLKYVQQKCPDVSEQDLHNSLIYNDTDSFYTSLKLFERYGYTLTDGDKISDSFYDLCQDIEDTINKQMTEWARKSLRSIDPRFVFKREAICDSGIFIGKKYYVLHLLDEEGVPCDKFKYKGVDVVKTTMPKAIKPYVKKVIECMILSKSLHETNKLFNEAYDIFNQLPIESISKNSGMNNFEQYSKKCDGLVTAKGMPFALKAAYYHDLIVENMGLQSKYDKFKSGDKVKIVNVKKPNQYNIDTIGFRGKFPEEFLEIFRIDHEMMFNKIFYAAIERFYEAVGWKLRKPNENLKIELEDFFGED